MPQRAPPGPPHEVHQGVSVLLPVFLSIEVYDQLFAFYTLESLPSNVIYYPVNDLTISGLLLASIAYFPTS